MAINQIKQQFASWIGGTPSQNEQALSRWLMQIDRDPTLLQVGRALQEKPSTGELVWRTREEGRRILQAAANILYKGDGLDIYPDIDAGLSYGARALLLVALRLLGVGLLPAKAADGTLATLEHFAEQRAVLAAVGAGVAAPPPEPLYALMITQSTDGVPRIIADLSSPGLFWVCEDGTAVEMPAWVWHAACCLGVWYRDGGTYAGPDSVAQTIVPPIGMRETVPTAVVHMFAKTVLNLGTLCQDGPAGTHGTGATRCQCNRVIAKLRQVPARHPEATGVMIPQLGGAVAGFHVHADDAPIIRSEPSSGGPPGERGQERRGTLGDMHPDMVGDLERTRLYRTPPPGSVPRPPAPPATHSQSNPQGSSPSDGTDPEGRRAPGGPGQGLGR